MTITKIEEKRFPFYVKAESKKYVRDKEDSSAQ